MRERYTAGFLSAALLRAAGQETINAFRDLSKDAFPASRSGMLTHDLAKILEQARVNIVFSAESLNLLLAFAVLETSWRLHRFSS
jgi:hypothetical protein